MKKILITDPIEKSCIQILEENGFAVDYKPGLKSDEVTQIIDRYEILIVRSGTKVTSSIIEKANSLKLIGRAGAGVDNIDVDAASRRGILVMNTPGGNTISTAEHTMALLLSMCRNIPYANSNLKSGIWDRKKYMGTELFGKTIGIIGFGKIGKEVAIRCKSFGMNVIANDPYISKDISEKLGVNLVNLNQLLSESDIISLHVPLNAETKYLIGQEELSLCKKGVKIIQCSRGGIISEIALLDALNNGQVSQTALDVYEAEPPIFPNELISHPNVIVTPHIGAATKEAQEKIAIQIAKQIVQYYKTKQLIGIVNLEVLKK